MAYNGPMDPQVREPEINSVELEVPVLEVCILGADRVPVILPPDEFKEFFTNFLEAIAFAMTPFGILSHGREKILHIDNIQTTGESYLLATNGDKKIERGVSNLLDALRTRKYQDLSDTCIHFLRKIAVLATKSQYDYEFTATGIEDISPTRVRANRAFDLPMEQPIPDETEIYGKLRAVVIEPPQIELELHDGSVLDISVSTQIAKSLEPKINKRIGLFGTLYFQLSDLKIVDYKVSEVLPYDPDFPLDETIRQLRKIVKESQKHFEDMGNLVSERKA